MTPNLLTPLLRHLSETVIGSVEAPLLLLNALLRNGYGLIEGAPGIGKTMHANTLANSTGGVFKFIQEPVSTY